MKTFYLSLLLLLFGSFLNYTNAQVIDVSNDKGCIANFNISSADCYGCGQQMPDGSGFCQPPSLGMPCPKCWTLEEDYWDETLNTQIYTLTIDPDGTPIVKQVHSVTQVPKTWGVRLEFIEI